MQKCFAEGSGLVYQDVLSWLQSSNTQLQLSGALAIANFARNGEIIVSKDLSDINHRFQEVPFLPFVNQANASQNKQYFSLKQYFIIRMSQMTFCNVGVTHSDEPT